MRLFSVIRGFARLTGTALSYYYSHTLPFFPSSKKECFWLKSLAVSLLGGILSGKEELVRKGAYSFTGLSPQHVLYGHLLSFNSEGRV